MIKMKKVSVLLPSNTNSTYDYLSPSSLELGTLVSVPFRNKEMKGIVWYDSSDEIPFEKLKKIKKVYNQIKLEKKSYLLYNLNIFRVFKIELFFLLTCLLNGPLNITTSFLAVVLLILIIS